MVQIEKTVVSNDSSIYEAWPDVALASNGEAICVFSECTHHGDRSYTRIMLSNSNDGGKTWSPKRPLTEGTSAVDYFYNCARISTLKDGRIVIIVDKLISEKNGSHEAENLLYFSCDNGNTWSEPQTTPLKGIVPDKVCELENGRWLISAHYKKNDRLIQVLHYSDNQGETWSEKITLADDERFNLCEVSLIPLSNNIVVAFLRENSGQGWDCKKCISYDNGESWGDVIDFPIPACHRPVSGQLKDGRILITYRFMQGGKGWLGHWTQNFFGALTDEESVLATSRNESSCRIFPIDYDRSLKSDLGYSGWVELENGKILIVNYIVDDAIDKAQICAYKLDIANLTINTGV